MLNEIPVLDKGYVALLSTSLPKKDFLQLQKEFFKNRLDDRLLSVPTIHFKMKCPLFVQMTFPEYGLSYIVSRSVTKPDAFVPTVAEVSAQTLESGEAIQADIERTTAALLVNPAAYQQDFCDPFISQVISPISVYNVIVVSGTLFDWLRFVNNISMPAPIEAYRKAVEAVITAEYDFLKANIGEKRDEQRKAGRNRDNL